MKKSETARIIAKLMIVYPSFKFGANILTGQENTLEEVVNVWHELIGDMEYKTVDAAVNECVKVCKFVPSIADITEKYNDIMAESKKDESEIRKAYDNARNYYPGSGEYGYGWKEFRARVKDAREAEQLQNIIIGYVRHLERIGAKEVMDFAECVRTVRRENGEIVAGDK